MLHHNENKRKQKISLVHQCDLPDTKKHVIVQFIDSGYFVNIRRKFRSFVMCSEKNPRSKLFLKSTAAIHLEKLNHLQYNYYMIHPFSMMRVLWEMFMMLILCILLIYIPIDVCMASNRTQSVSKRMPKIVLDGICFIDICMSFFTGYQHHMTKKIIMNPRKVSLHYLRTWFVLDFISSLNPDMIIIIFRLRYSGTWPKIPSFLKIFRLATLLKYMDRFREWKQFSHYKLKLTKLGVVMVVLITWNTSFLFLIASQVGEVWIPTIVSTDPPAVRQRLTIEGMRLAFIRIVMNFMLVSHGERNSQNLIIISFEIIWLSIGWIIKLSATAQIVQIVMKYSSLSDKYYQMVQQFQEYMRSKSLPESVQKRVLDYFEFRFQRNYYKESEILGSLSNQLKQEIIVHTCNGLFKNTKIFKNVPYSFLVRISYYMKMEIYLPNDVVVSAGNDATYMCFILTGMVAVYDTSGKEVCHMADGAYFGEMSLFSMLEKRTASVVSIDFCEVYTLSRTDFAEAIAPYPDLLSKIERQTKEQQKQFLIMETERKYSAGELVDDQDKPITSRIRSYYNI